MVGTILLAVLVLLLILIFFVPYGVDAQYADEIFRLKVKAGPLRIGILPKKPKTEKQIQKAEQRKEKKKAKKALKAEKKAAKEENKDETEKVKPKPTIDFLLALAKMGAHAIGRFFRSFSIDYLALDYVVATDDPYDTAIRYAAVCAGVESVGEMAADVIHVKKKDIRIGSDFSADKPVISGRIVVSLRLCSIVYLALAFVVEFIQYKAKHRPAPSDVSGNERKDQNGREQDQ